MTMNDPFYVLESNKVGFKIVYCPIGKPQGGRDNGNYTVIADGMKRQEAADMHKRLNGGPIT